MYCPPDNKIHPKNDVWNLGILMHTLLYREHPFQGASINEVKSKIKAYKPNDESIIHSFVS